LGDHPAGRVELPSMRDELLTVVQSVEKLVADATDTGKWRFKLDMTVFKGKSGLPNYAHRERSPTALMENCPPPPMPLSVPTNTPASAFPRTNHVVSSSSSSVEDEEQLPRSFVQVIHAATAPVQSVHPQRPFPPSPNNAFNLEDYYC
jgi:hypothetical protein